MKVVLSIKPKYANKIFEGIKKYEFRRVIFKNQNIKTVIVYASSPICKVIGEFEIEKIINQDIDSLWQSTQAFAGITKEYFYKYFTQKEMGFAIQIKKVKKYKQPKCLKKDFKLQPPQSFAYFQLTDDDSCHLL